MHVETLLNELPPFLGNYRLVSHAQTVGQIINEVVEAHKRFFTDYDKIAKHFYYPDPVKTFKGLFSFLKGNVEYREESEEKQTITSPAGILSLGEGDCKHYASFIGGVLDALKRAGEKIDWFYRFASYDPFQREPGHVFVVAEFNGREYWIDPVLSSFDNRLQYSSKIDKRINIPNMALYRVSGIDDYNATMEALREDDGELDPELVRAIQLLMFYGVLSVDGTVNDALFENLHGSLPEQTFNDLVQARITLNNAAVGGIFKSIWRGVKKVALSPLRNAFLSLVALNVFGYGSKLKRALWDAGGNYTEFKDKLKKLWQDRFGGTFSKLENAIRSGAKKKAILGAKNAVGCCDGSLLYSNGGKVGAAPAAVPVWVATASAVIAAIMPLVNAFLKAKQQQTGLPMDDPNLFPYGVCADGFTPKAPDGNCAASPEDSGGGVVSWVKQNPVMAAGIAVGGYFIYKKFIAKR